MDFYITLLVRVALLAFGTHFFYTGVMALYADGVLIQAGLTTLGRHIQPLAIHFAMLLGGLGLIAYSVPALMRSIQEWRSGRRRRI